MSELKNLVPPLELCKLIPQGEFEDSVFVWVVKGDYQPKFQIVDKRKYPFIPEDGATLYPAPTLQEIMVEIDNLGGWCPTAYRLQNQWTVDYQEDKEDGMNEVMEQTDPDNPATAALRLFFKLKGIEA